MKNGLNIKAFALSCGIIWSLAVLVVSLISMTNGYGGAFVELIASVYLGYSASVAGAFVGAAWGFVDAGIGGLVFAWLYNKLATKLS